MEEGLATLKTTKKEAEDPPAPKEEVKAKAGV